VPSLSLFPVLAISGKLPDAQCLGIECLDKALVAFPVDGYVLFLD